MNAPYRPESQAVPAGVTAYRPFIDGLRAVSILSVVAYHVGIPGVSGGYVGVDVFFVISGFLIISQIVEGLERGKFSFGEFWSRRALRILPPYFLVMAFSIAAAPFVLTMPDEFQEFGKEVGHAAVMVVNHLFLIQQGYFDGASDTKVLLHFWSLAVEEQFYLVAPLLLAAAWWVPARLGRPGLRAPVLAWVAAGLFAASLAGCVLLTGVEGERNYAFYLSPLRAWEFIAGGALGFLLPAAGRWSMRAHGWLAAAGLAAILVSVFAYTAETPYPSWRVALPVFGASAIILAGLVNPYAPAIRLLATRPMVWIGLVSYAWYLWHWPLLAFARIADFGERDFARDLALGLLSLALAAATFYLLERPLRRWRQKRGKPLGWRPVFAGTAACAAVAVGGLLSFDAVHKRLDAAIGPQYLPSYPPPVTFCDLATADAAACNAMAAGRPIGLLVGDSHALSGRDRLAAFAEERGGLLVSMAGPGCMTFLGERVIIFDTRFAPACENVRVNALPMVTGGAVKPRYAILYARWPLYGSLKRSYQLGPVDSNDAYADQESAFIDGLKSTIGGFRALGMERILVIGPSPLFARAAPNCLFLADHYGMDRVKTCGIARAVAEGERRIALRRLEAALQPSADLRFVEPFDAFCDADHCLPYVDGETLFTDNNHVAYNGMGRIISTHQADFDWVAGTAD